MEPEQKEFLKAVKYHTAVFFAAFACFYIIAAFISWEWKMREWWWSVRFVVIACSAYMSHVYAPLFYKKEEKEELNEYNGAP